jgi:hypothetical protein
MKKRATKKTGGANITGSMGAVESGSDGFAQEAWQGTLEEKILFLADRYVNHGDARLYWEMLREWKKDRSEVAKDARKRLALDTEALAGLAFFRELEPLIKDNARLEWLRDILAESVRKRWKYQIKDHKDRARRQRNAKREKFGLNKISKKALEWEVPRHKTIASLARHLGVDVKTTKSYAKRYGLELRSRSVKPR